MISAQCLNDIINSTFFMLFKERNVTVNASLTHHLEKAYERPRQGQVHRIERSSTR